ncbi:hypothetical protein R1flu_022573 [Riccia fluitans]|uniref:Uncharacterized protein n=1 Tax=Riccia fluitans TaxID=41844 RepID=A0ABD1XPM8_9MARC
MMPVVEFSLLVELSASQRRDQLPVERYSKWEKNSLPRESWLIHGRDLNSQPYKRIIRRMVYSFLITILGRRLKAQFEKMQPVKQGTIGKESQEENVPRKSVDVNFPKNG